MGLWSLRRGAGKPPFKRQKPRWQGWAIGGLGMVAGRPVARPPGIEGWIGGRPAAVETLRVLVSEPKGRRVADLERMTGDARQVVRTLNELQHAGLVKIHVE